jgi:hypothetical protein
VDLTGGRAQGSSRHANFRGLIVADYLSDRIRSSVAFQNYLWKDISFSDIWPQQSEVRDLWTLHSTRLVLNL